MADLTTKAGRDELRQAAERLIEYCRTQFLKHRGAALAGLFDADKVARAYLDLADAGEWRADDAEPVTEEWLRAMGAEQVDSLAEHWVIAHKHPAFSVFYYPHGETLRLQTNNLDFDGKTSFGGCHIVTDSPTRGQVRRLCAALGITLPPPPARTAGEEK